MWDDYLDLATPGLTPIPGQVCIARTIGYTPEQLSEILKTNVEIIMRATKRMEELRMITKENNGVIVINSWKEHQSDYQRQKGYRGELQQEVTGKGNKVDKNRRDIDIDKKYNRKEYKGIYIQALELWNSEKIITHKYMSNGCMGAINAKLDYGYTDKEIYQAIKNYAAIVKGKTYFWTHRWTLEEFIKRGLDKFMDLEVAKKNYADKYRKDDEDIQEIRDLDK